MTASLDITCRARSAGWECEVTIDDASGRSRHTVGVSAAALVDLNPAADNPESLVRESFAFLLERESKESILRSFDLPVIGRYFPEFELEIRHRLRGQSDSATRP